MFSKYTRKKGFTMMELLVSIFILVVLTAIVVANLNRGSKKDDLRRSATEVVSLLRKAQNLALVGSQQALPDLPEGSKSSGAFGIHFDLNNPSQYLLFLDFQNSGGEYVPDGQYQSGEELPNSTYYLTAGVTIASLAPIGENDILDITFAPPKAYTYFNGFLIETSQANITLTQNITQDNQYIKINRISGQISIENEL